MRDRALKLTDLAAFYERFSSPFSPTNEDSPSFSILMKKRTTHVPAPLVQAGSSICPPLKNFPIPDVTICYLPNAILSQAGAVVVDEQHIISESVEGAPAESGFAVTDGVPHLDLDSVNNSDEVVLAISKNGTWNYSLFISEIVPLAFVAVLNSATESLRIPMLFREFMSPHAVKLRKDLLEAVGIDRDRIFTPQPGFTRYKGIVFIKANERYKNHRVSQLMPYIAGRLKGDFTNATAPVSRRLYISRQKAPSRKVSNFDELSATVLTPFNLHPVELEDLDLHDQIDLFSKADLVVAEHGAALVNTMFMRPGSTVIEMTPNEMVGRWMYRMISYYGHLNYIFGAFETPPGWVWHRDNYAVPCALYRQLLEQAPR
jgi:hypothetical protein